MTAYDPDELREFATAVLDRLGAPETVAQKVSDSLVAADLRGHTSHGVLRIPTYRDMIDDGALVPDASPTVLREEGPTAVIDGRLAFGQVVGRDAVALLLNLVRDHGVACVGIRNGTHLGRMGEWAECVAEEGYLFSSAVNSSGGGLVTALAGTADRTFSTNPITFGIPSFDRLPFQIVLDMATSQVAHGKVQQYEAAARELPAEWALSPDGETITDPAELSEFHEAADWGSLRPLGGTTAGYKGTGLAVTVELFAGLMGGGPVVGQRDPTSWFSNGASFFAVDPRRFADRGALEAKVDAVVTQFRAAESLPNVPVGNGAKGDDPLLPGEAEYTTLQDRRESGVPLPERFVDSLTDLAEELELAESNPLA